MEDENGHQWDTSEHLQGQMLHVMNDEFNDFILDQTQRSRPSEDWEESEIEHAHYDTVVRCFVKKNSRPVEMATLVDKASRVLFPLTFFLYNVAYWLTYYHGITIFPRVLQRFD